MYELKKEEQLQTIEKLLQPGSVCIAGSRVQVLDLDHEKTVNYTAINRPVHPIFHFQLIAKELKLKANVKFNNFVQHIQKVGKSNFREPSKDKALHKCHIGMNQN